MNGRTWDAAWGPQGFGKWRYIPHTVEAQEMFSDSMGVDALCKKNHLFYDKQIFVENKTPLTDLVPVQKQIT